jgi:hypothetical protein
MTQNKETNKLTNNVNIINNNENHNENNKKQKKNIKRKKVNTSIKKRKAKSLNNVKSSIKKNKNKNIVTKEPKRKTNNRNRKSRSLTTIHNKQKGGYAETTDSELCSRDINDLLSTNKKVFTYNQPGNQFESMKRDGIASKEMAEKGWGSNPGPPPDPSKCVIM